MDTPERPAFEVLTEILGGELTEWFGAETPASSTVDIAGLAEALAGAVADRFTLVSRGEFYTGLDYEVVRWPTNLASQGVGSQFISMLMQRSEQGLELIAALPTDRDGEHFLVFKGSRLTG